MIIDRLRWYRQLLLAEDGGGGGDTPPADETAETPPESPETGEGAEPEERELQEPGYFAQLPNDKAKSEAYKALYKYQRLDDLADALIKAEDDLAAFNSKRALIVPEKGDKEGIEKFKESLGVPKDHKEYKLAALNDFAGDNGKTIEAIQKGCQRIMLTPHQAEAVAEMMAAASKSLGIRAELNKREAVRHQTERVAASYAGTIDADIDRQKAAEEDVALYTSWLKETGLEETISKSMLAGNPQLIRAISAYAKKHSGTVTPRGTSMGSGPKPQGRSVNTYSQDWENYKKQRGGA